MVINEFTTVYQQLDYYEIVFYTTVIVQLSELFNVNVVFILLRQPLTAGVQPGRQHYYGALLVILLLLFISVFGKCLPLSLSLSLTFVLSLF